MKPKPRAQASTFPTGRGDLAASLVLVFPLLLAYEVGVLFVGRVNGADVVTRALYALVGSRTVYLLLHAVLAIAFLVWVRRHRLWDTLRLEIVAPVVLEAAIYALTLGSVITLILNHAFGLAVGGDTLISACGAGVHEELVFRLGLCGALVAMLRGAGRLAVAIAFVASSLLFAGAHHLGPNGEPFTAHAFVFRAFAGVAFAAIYWFRSLAHAVYAHALYDLGVAATS